MDTAFYVEVLNVALHQLGKLKIFNTNQRSQFTLTDFTNILKSNKLKLVWTVKAELWTIFLLKDYREVLSMSKI